VLIYLTRHAYLSDADKTCLFTCLFTYRYVNKQVSK